MYNYYAWPDRKRLRLSQILIWPPFQRQGLGRLLLQSVYALAERINCVDVTVTFFAPPSPCCLLMF